MTEPLTDDRRTPLRAGGGYLESAVPRGRHRAEDPAPEPAEYAVRDVPVPGLAPAPPPRAAAPVREPVAQAPRPEPPAPPRPTAPRRPAPAAASAPDFYGPSSGRPVFSPGNASPFHVARTEAAPRRVGRNPVRTVLTWAAVLVAVAIGAEYGYPVVMDQVHAKEIAAVSADLQEAAAGQDAYHRFNGVYGGDIASLNLPGTISKLTVVTATIDGYCLKGQSRTGGVVRYYSPARGVTTTPCG
ncbi:hypothetical protein [Kineococcus aurantiacus]|uniref:Uncharacterized protein n=1 Tax=Kineococcus aurantiacus TaxID=37633 RepID=A0A7Y9ASA1_9ACTN|nr:hypothetical protein [Kineococcus aurantiacus]NYD20809.1 hypothetical protein [Kineococcus aurantiacus]